MEGEGMERIEHVSLLPSEAYDRRQRDEAYLMELKEENLLFAYRTEAGLNGRLNYRISADTHGGWDNPLSQIRGTFTGHWLSAAAHMYRQTGNKRLKAKADYIVEEIGRCQEANGDGWAFSIPEKYLYGLKRGRHFWACQYVCHKTMMGLMDMYRFGGNKQALEILRGCAEWFHAFTDEIDRETMDQMMDDEETGGMMELWADLYQEDPDPRYLELMRRYERPRLTEAVLNGTDVLTNMHANATIPEIHGCARAYEVTGEERYRKVVENYWELAVNRRGSFATGGQTDGESLTPPNRQSARLSDMNQEHCVVYNMIRLADYLYRWSGKKEYHDYIEQNIYNGLFAQGFWQGRTLEGALEDHIPDTGIVCYYLPLAAKSTKKWGRKIEDFWCCHGTSVQANAQYSRWIWYQDQDGIAVEQYLPSRMETVWNGKNVSITMEDSNLGGNYLRIMEVARTLDQRPEYWKKSLHITADQAEFELRFRLPWWLRENVVLTIDGMDADYEVRNGEGVIKRVWTDSIVEILLPCKLTAWPLADSPDCVAFLNGPVLLAGVDTDEVRLHGDKDNPQSILTPSHEREWEHWKEDYRTVGQERNFCFKPLKNIGREMYTVYFPVEK